MDFDEDKLQAQRAEAFEKEWLANNDPELSQKASVGTEKPAYYEVEVEPVYGEENQVVGRYESAAEAEKVFGETQPAFDGGGVYVRDSNGEVAASKHDERQYNAATDSFDKVGVREERSQSFENAIKDELGVEQQQAPAKVSHYEIEVEPILGEENQVVGRYESAAEAEKAFGETQPAFDGGGVYVRDSNGEVAAAKHDQRQHNAATDSFEKVGVHESRSQDFENAIAGERAVEQEPSPANWRSRLQNKESAAERGVSDEVRAYAQETRRSISESQQASISQQKEKSSEQQLG